MNTALSGSFFYENDILIPNFYLLLILFTCYLFFYLIFFFLWNRHTCEEIWEKEENEFWQEKHSNLNTLLEKSSLLRDFVSLYEWVNLLIIIVSKSYEEPNVFFCCQVPTCEGETFIKGFCVKIREKEKWFLNKK